jgi:hypothetical protein
MQDGSFAQDLCSQIGDALGRLWATNDPLCQSLADAGYEQSYYNEDANEPGLDAWVPIDTIAHYVNGTFVSQDTIWTNEIHWKVKPYTGGGAALLAHELAHLSLHYSEDDAREVQRYCEELLPLDQQAGRSGGE